MVGETIDSIAGNSGPTDPVVIANAKELEKIAKLQSKSNNTKIVGTGLEYHQEHAYLNIRTGLFTRDQPTMDKENCYRITFNLYANGQILQEYDSSGGMHEGTVNLSRKQVLLEKSDVIPKEITDKVFDAITYHNLSQKNKTGSKRLAGQFYVRANSDAPKAPPKEGCMARLYKILKWM
mgnify:CR=1 FL=1